MHPIQRLVLAKLAEDRQALLKPLSDEALMKLWDEYDGCNTPGGHSGEDIHMELNQRGLGHYCAV